MQTRVRVTVRPVSLEDRTALGAMLSRLSARTIYERFHAPYPRVPAWALAGMVEADHDEKEALVAVAGAEIVGHAMYVRAREGRAAEFAVVVEDGWQSRGIGRLLLADLAAKAISRGIHLFTGPVLGENRRALAALAAVFPGMRYGMKDGAYQLRAPLPSSPTKRPARRSPETRAPVPVVPIGPSGEPEPDT
jgi:GNAT superfamily N-acetyltransferase